MLIEKDVWDLVKVGPQKDPEALWKKKKKIKENQMAVGTATRIIKESVHNDIFKNIINVTDLREIWQKLQIACSQIGQKVVYLILQKLLNYPRTNKPQGFEKPVMSIFADVRFLIKRLQAAITPDQDIWDSIVIVVALNSLHDNFEATTASMLEREDKTIEEIQQILASAEAKLISKQATRMTKDLAMASRGGYKCKAFSIDKCFNYGRLVYYGKDCNQPDMRLPIADNKPADKKPRRDESTHSSSPRQHLSS